MNKTLNNQIGWLRLIALIEGISFLLILFVSMPLKYIWNIPEPNIYMGTAMVFYLCCTLLQYYLCPEY